MNKKILDARAVKIGAYREMNFIDPYSHANLQMLFSLTYKQGYRDAVRELRLRVKAGENFADKNNIIADIARDFIKPLR